MKRRAWSPALILQRIGDRFNHALSMAPKDVIAKDSRLYHIARYYFGSWEAALAAANIRIPRPKPWSKKEILKVLKDEEARFGFASQLRLQEISQKRGSDLRRAIRNEFGSLTNAKKAANVTCWPLWTKQRVLEELKKYLPNAIHYRTEKKRNRRLVSATERLFGTWSAAIRAAGIPRAMAAHPSWKWPAHRVIDVLREAHRIGPVRINPLRNRFPGIYWAAKKHFRTWAAALTAAKIPRSSWSRELLYRHSSQEKDASPP